jgi:acetyl esterase
MTPTEGGGGATDLFQGLAFRQVVEMLESSDHEPSLGAMDAADLERRFPELANIGVQDITIDGMDGDVAGRVYRGSDVGGAGLVWVHGGGFIGGDLNMPEAHWVALAIAARGFPVLSLDYRKSLRGVHYPLPSDDVLAGWLWATTHADELGVAANELHLGGASAGGNLVAGVTKRLRDGAGPMPSSLVLVYPVVHGELPSLSAELREKLAADEIAVSSSTAMFREMTLQYAGGEAVLGDPYAFAANGEVNGQPPVLILNSERDFLRASGEAYAEELRLAGVDVTVETEPGTSHGHVNGPDVEGSLRSIDRIAQWLRERGSQECR